jgi:hypothetical protein
MLSHVIPFYRTGLYRTVLDGRGEAAEDQACSRSIQGVGAATEESREQHRGKHRNTGSAESTLSSLCSYPVTGTGRCGHTKGDVLYNLFTLAPFLPLRHLGRVPDDP